MFARYDVIVAVAWAYMFGACLILLSVLTWCGGRREGRRASLWFLQRTPSPVFLQRLSANTAADWHFTPINVAAIAYSAVLSSALNYFLMAW